MNWLQALQQDNYTLAEELFTSKLTEPHSVYNEKQYLMFIQAFKNKNDTTTAVSYMRKYLPYFAPTEHKVILLGWLAEALPHLDKTPEDIDAAIAYGTQAIVLSDQLVTQQFSQSLTNAVVFSLYGDNPKYCETIQLNAELMPTIYPNFTMVVYHDKSVPQHVLSRLADKNVTLIDVSTDAQISNIPGTFWRFLALDSDLYDVILFRDADSVISDREQTLVEHWLASDKYFHIIRDGYTHTDLILAGLWGARGQLLQGTAARMQRYVKHQTKLHSTHADQHFLRDEVWSRIKHLALHHYALFDTPLATWPIEVAKCELGYNSMGGVSMTNYDLSSNPGNQYQFRIISNSNQQLICQYTLHNQTAFTLPRQYADRIRSNEWRLTITAMPVITTSYQSST